MIGLAASIGQFSGGALVEWSPFEWGWRTVFLAKLPIGVSWCSPPGSWCRRPAPAVAKSSTLAVRR